MASLFVDTSELLIIGLLDEQFNWLEYQELKDKKSSAVIHALIYEMLGKYDLKLKDVKSYFQVAGPGSYTGMRVSEGISQVLDWQEMDVYSFYHFEVPKILGESEGAWISSAFKGEAFIYSWNGSEVEKELIQQDSLTDRLVKLALPVFTHFEGNFDLDSKLTSMMIKDNSAELFTKIVEQNLKRSPFYYRTLEKEFKVSKK
jgi:tRNA threonylcarbamoyladenosine biosynthesis protein TsaB